MADGRDPGTDLSSRPRALAWMLRSGLRYAAVRLEILEFELAAERERVGKLLARGLALSLAVMMTAQATALLLVALAWDTRMRLPAIAVLALLSLAVAVAIWRSLRQLRSAPGRPITAALHALDHPDRVGGGHE